MLGSRTLCTVLSWSSIPLFRSTCHQFRSQFRSQSQRLMSTQKPIHGWIPGRYPIARRSDHFDTYKSAEKGEDVKIHDPYQWLETSSDETTRWIEGIRTRLVHIAIFLIEVHQNRSNLRRNTYKRALIESSSRN